MKRAHMVGNGPSYVDFKKIDEEDYVVGCNIPQVASDLTFICDIRMLNTINEKNIKLPCPAMVSQKINNVIQKNKYRYKNLFEIKGVIKKINKAIPSSISSGHYAVLWLIENGYKEIHIWGCDGLVNHTMESKTDEYVKVSIKSNKKHCERHTNKWRKSWIEIINKYKDVQFNFHNFAGGKIT